MNRQFLLLVVLLLLRFGGMAQTDSGAATQKKDTAVQRVKPLLKPDTLHTTTDTIVKGIDTVPVKTDSAMGFHPVVTDTQKMQRFQDQLKHHPYYNFFGKSLSLVSLEKKGVGSENFFYLLLILVFYYAMIRALFPKYHANLFTLFFRATLRQQQLREQLVQSTLPSLLLNILFILSGSLYISLLAKYEGVLTGIDFWILWLYAMAALAGIYLGKFMVIKTVGWILRTVRASDAYIFVVFMVNKMTGIFLLPVIALMAFPNPALLPVVVTLSIVLLTGLLGYRFLISYRVVRNEIKVNPFHFFIYLCAFEIAPLLLVYKVLLNFVERTI